MIIRKITLENFRSHRGLTYFPSEGVNIICGQNGRGKTNLLEAVYLLTGVKSWRTGSRHELVAWGEGLSRIGAAVQSRGREFEISMEIPRDSRARGLVNGIAVSRENPLSGVLRAVLFCPEDLELVKGPPSGRRDLMDGAVSQLFPRYASLLSRYSRLILAKGKLLRGHRDGKNSVEILPEINAQLAFFGAKIIGFRADFCRKLGEKAAIFHSQISRGSEMLAVEYKTVSSVSNPFSSENEGALLDHLQSRSVAEIAAGACLVGPHRDDIEMSINGKPARAFASQGQARSAALSLRFAQREIFASDLGEPPLLLLDDILSELDEPRRDFVCRAAVGGQCIITCCAPEREFDGANVLRL